MAKPLIDLRIAEAEKRLRQFHFTNKHGIPFALDKATGQKRRKVDDKKVGKPADYIVLEAGGVPLIAFEIPKGRKNAALMLEALPEDLDNYRNNVADTITTLDVFVALMDDTYPMVAEWAPGKGEIATQTDTRPARQKPEPSADVRQKAQA